MSEATKPNRAETIKVGDVVALRSAWGESIPATVTKVRTAGRVDLTFDEMKRDHATGTAAPAPTEIHCSPYDPSCTLPDSWS